MNTTPFLAPNNDSVYARQIAFIAAFLLPAAKFLETPSLLAKDAAGDILLPALLHFILQAGVLFALVYACSRSEKTLFERLNEWLGKGAGAVYILFALYYLFAAVLPLLDLEKFVYAAFYDTSPTTFSFAVFFVFSAFVCTRGLKTLGRVGDICLFLFVLPFSAILFMSLGEADFTHLLPVFGEQFGSTMSAFKHTSPHFSDAVLLLPFIGNLRYQKGDGTKIMAGYGVGAGITLIFLAVFFGIYSSIAPREHYAFSKIAQYFPALSVIGRADLIFVYLLTVVLLFTTCLPLHYSVDFVCRTVGTRRRALFSAVLNIGAFVFVFFNNKRYNAFYGVISGKLYLVFILVADILPLFCLLLPKKENKHA
ncbi:MAG: GerAB/ArcD/ProY family transporter [Clostridia bacterium]|nr:GerAB/ArcD/ProY family transporter [Clostridia bacterium]